MLLYSRYYVCMFCIITFVFPPPLPTVHCKPFSTLVPFALFSSFFTPPSAIPVRSAVFTECTVVISALSLVNSLSLTLSGTAQPFVPALFFDSQAPGQILFLIYCTAPPSPYFFPSPPPWLPEFLPGYINSVDPPNQKAST